MREKHGMKGTKIYGVWETMKSRCNNPNNKEYHNYGGRGIEICIEWKKFSIFYKDMGKSYKEGLQIDRRDNNGNYSKDNCRWITCKKNCRNKRTNINFTYNGKTKCLKEWSEILGLKYKTVFARYKYYGKTFEEALELI